jgi:hypothetical protein
MFRIPTLGLFLTCTESSFYLNIHIFSMRAHLTYWLKNWNPHTWEGSPHGGECPIHSGPLLEANCLAPLAFFPHPLHLLRFLHTAFILHKKITLTSPILLSGTGTLHYSWGTFRTASRNTCADIGIPVFIVSVRYWNQKCLTSSPYSDSGPFWHH